MNRLGDSARRSVALSPRYFLRYLALIPVSSDFVDRLTPRQRAPLPTDILLRLLPRIIRTVLNRFALFITLWRLQPDEPAIRPPIEAHGSKGSEASKVIDRFNGLKARERQDIITLLRSL